MAGMCPAARWGNEHKGELNINPVPKLTVLNEEE